MADWLEELAQLEQAATPGPWRFWDNRGKPTWTHYKDGEQPPDGVIEGDAHQGVLIGGHNCTVTLPQDSMLIAALRNAAPRLLAIARAAMNLHGLVLHTHRAGVSCAVCELRAALAEPTPTTKVEVAP